MSPTNGAESAPTDTMGLRDVKLRPGGQHLITSSRVIIEGEKQSPLDGVVHCNAPGVRGRLDIVILEYGKGFEVRVGKKGRHQYQSGPEKWTYFPLTEPFPVEDDKFFLVRIEGTAGSMVRFSLTRTSKGLEVKRF